MNTSYRYLVGDVFERLKELPDASVDLVFTSPPFLALRSYLPADHPEKSKEIGSEPTPADFIDTMLDVVAECRRVLSPHGSLVFELGDTYSGSGGAGGDYDADGLRGGQPHFTGSAGRRTARTSTRRVSSDGIDFNGAMRHADADIPKRGPGWPLDKSLCFIPQLFGVALAYGVNPLTGRQVDRWRVRNVIAWCRPNPPVGALGDKCRPGTSYLTVACTSRTRWFDMDAVRTPVQHPDAQASHLSGKDVEKRGGLRPYHGSMSAGAPLLDWWSIPTQPYTGSHYATFPEELARRVILLMCPEKVCTICGEPSLRITEASYVDSDGSPAEKTSWSSGVGDGMGAHSLKTSALSSRPVTTGWTDCEHSAWRPGIVLDPFAGSGTTLWMALGNGRSGIGIDLDSRNAELARDRVGPLYLEVEMPENVA